MSDIECKAATQADQALSRLDAEITELSMALSGLEARLDPILAPLPPEVAGPGTAPDYCGSSPVLQRLGNLTSNIAVLTDFVRRTRDRLEV